MSATAVTDSLTVPLDASPATVRDALLRLDLTGPMGAYVSIRTGLLGTDRDAHARLLAAWGAVGPLSRGFVQRAARSIRSHAEDDERWQAAAEDDLRQVAA